MKLIVTVVPAFWIVKNRRVFREARIRIQLKTRAMRRAGKRFDRFGRTAADLAAKPTSHGSDLEECQSQSNDEAAEQLKGARLDPTLPVRQAPC